MEKCQRRWAKQRLHLYHLPLYSPEFNRIKALRKHTKYF